MPCAKSCGSRYKEVMGATFEGARSGFRSPLSRRQARGNDARKVRRLSDNAVNVPSFTQVDR